MTRCPQAPRVQDFLDGDLAPAEAAAFRAHLAVCTECAGEVALFERLITTLERPALVEPPAGLTERVLARVLPSRARRRRLAVLGWSYLGALTACAAAVGLWVAQPAGRASLEDASAVLSR